MFYCGKHRRTFYYSACDSVRAPRGILQRFKYLPARSFRSAAIITWCISLSAFVYLVFFSAPITRDHWYVNYANCADCVFTGEIRVQLLVTGENGTRSLNWSQEYRFEGSISPVGTVSWRRVWIGEREKGNEREGIRHWLVSWCVFKYEYFGGKEDHSL